MAKYSSSPYISLAQLQAEQQKWGHLTAQIFADLKVRITEEEMHTEQQRTFLITAVHAVALIGDYGVENDWEPEETYNACKNAIKKLAREAGFLPDYLH